MVRRARRLSRIFSASLNKVDVSVLPSRALGQVRTESEAASVS